jgi:two-component system, response regulator YesN
MKLLIVDDEIQIRTGLRDGLDWSELGIDNVFAAADGLEAMEIFMEQTPEIVITDIRMPGMDGLELSKRIKDVSDIAQIIILSGYSDFDYAKKAIQLGVTDYELKPIKIKDLIKLVTLARDTVMEKMKKVEEEHKLKEVYKNKFFGSIFSGEVSDKQFIKEGMENYFNIDGHGSFICFTANLEESEHKLDAGERAGCEFETGILINYMEDKLEGFRRIIYKYSENTFAILLNADWSCFGSRFKLQLKELLRALNELFEREYGISVSIGVSNVGDIGSLSQLFVHSTEALKHKLHMGKKSIIFYEDLVLGNENKHLSIINEKELGDNIVKFNYEAASENIYKEFDSLKKQKCTNNDTVKHICIDLKNILVRTVRDEGINIEGLFGSNLEYFNEIRNFEFIDEYKKWVLDLYYLVITGLSDIKGIRYNALMLKAAEYIKKNYYRDLTIDELSEYVKKSPNYFSHLFKKEFGLSFSEYLNRLRVNEAKNLIKNSSMLAYEIAEKVGFQDYKYFVQVFKKVEGYSPSEFRKNKLIE